MLSSFKNIIEIIVVKLWKNEGVYLLKFLYLGLWQHKMAENAFTEARWLVFRYINHIIKYINDFL